MPDEFWAEIADRCILCSGCNLACPVCFMADGEFPQDPSLDSIQKMFETIRHYDGSSVSIQISGGEPTVREDLPDIIALGTQLGFEAIELNTNGLVIGRDPAYQKKLKHAGLKNVYLQFDSLDPAITKKLRGRDVLAEKLQAIENCRDEGLSVILSVTIIRGINDGKLGRLIEFAMNNLDVIKGLALQPAFISGRFDVTKQKHLSIGDVALLISEQTNDKIEFQDFWPVGSSHPLCYGSTYLIGEGENYFPFTRHLQQEDYRELFDNLSPQGAVFQDIVARITDDNKIPTGLPILIMEYMDAWTMDLERVQACNLAVTEGNGTSIPFCVYHLTDDKGRRLYPHGGRSNYGCSA